MAKYSDEIRERALKMLDEIGPGKASKEMQIGKQTLYRWRKEQSIKSSSSKNKPPEQQDIADNPVSETKVLPDQVNDSSMKIPEIEAKLKQELEDMRHLNQIVEETIDYLIIENRQLRERCERYLKAISLMAKLEE